MKQDELIAKLKTIISPYVQDEAALETLTEDTDLMKDLKINSANLIDIILDIEEAFDIQIENEEMEQMLDLKSTMAIVNAKIEA